MVVGPRLRCPCLSAGVKLDGVQQVLPVRMDDAEMRGERIEGEG